MASNDLRIYRSAAFGVTGAAGHVYIYSPELKEGVGTARDGGGGVDSLGNQYYTIPTSQLGGQSQTQVFNKAKGYQGWNTGIYMLWKNDCFTEVEGALEHAGVDHEVKFKRLDFSRFFSGRTVAAKSKKIADEFISTLFVNSEESRDKITRVITRRAKSTHDYTSRSGRLKSSVRAVKRKNVTEIYAAAPYADKVMQTTKDDFVKRAAVESESTINGIIKSDTDRGLSGNTNKLDAMVTDMGRDIMEDQFDQVV